MASLTPTRGATPAPMATASSVQLAPDHLADPLQDPLSDPLQMKPDGGGHGDEGSSEIVVDDARDVVKRSNVHAADGSDPLWKGVNGTSSALSTSNKPAEWSRGIILVDEQQPDGSTMQVPKMIGSGAKGVVKDEDGTYTDGDAGMSADMGVGSIEAYRQRLIDDFDFGGVIAYYLEKGDGARSSFIEDMLKKYAPNVGPEDPKHVRISALSRELWSYATKGMGTDGRTDIAEMQGILYAIDAEIVKTSDSNTKMSEETFKLPGTDIEIPMGDGAHGRATILTTRHLLGKVEGGNDDLEGYDKSLIFTDISASMTPEMSKLASLIEVGNLDGDIDVATFHDDELSLQYTKMPNITKEEQAKLDALEAERVKLAKVNSDAYKAYKAAPNQPGLKVAWTEALTAYRAAKKVYEAYFSEIRGRSPDEAAAVLRAAADGTTTDPAFDMWNSSRGKEATKNGKANPPMEESGLAAALLHLNKLPAPEAPPKRPFKNQIIIMTDENDADPGKLGDLKKAADARGFDVRIIFSMQQGGAAETFKIIDLAKVDMAKVKDMVVGGARGVPQSLNWRKVASAQGAEEKRWLDYNRE